MKLTNFTKPLMKRLKIGHALWKSIKEFLLRTYVHSYHYLVDADRMIPEKLMWFALHSCMFTASIYVVLFAWSRFTENPTITTLDSQHYSIFNLNFPGIAICPNNKLSRRKVEEYADILLQRNIPRQYRSKRRLVDLIAYFGHLYDSEIERVEEFSKFQEMLDNYDADFLTGVFNSQKRLRFLAPTCSDLILKCKWAGAEINCSEIIQDRLTNEGFCCTFNYVKSTENGSLPVKARIPAGIGPDQGLTVLLNLTSSDYYYPLKNFQGATALVFDPHEFADSTTGAVREVPLEQFLETRITLNALTKKAVPEVQRYSIEKRECLFPTDMMSEFGGNYIFGDCLAKCKLKSVIALCKCIPYNYPTNFPDVDTKLPFCNLNDVSCMNKYKVKWGNFKPREFIKALEREMEDSLSCEYCYPLCSSTVYIVDSTSSKLNFFYQNKGSVIAGMNESSDLSVLKVYFSQTESILYKTDVLYAWYDIVSDYGGLLSLFLGCSIISIFEIFYFVTFRFYQNLFNRTSFMNIFEKKKPAVFGNKAFHRANFEYIH